LVVSIDTTEVVLRFISRETPTAKLKYRMQKLKIAMG